MLLPIAAFGQRQVTLDTMYLEKTCIDTICTYTEVRTTAYADGETIIRKIELGDSATTVNYVVNRAIEKNRGYASYAFFVLQKRELLQSMNADDNTLEANALPGLYDELAVKFESNYLGAIRATVGDSTQTGEVYKTNAGLWRIKWGTRTPARFQIMSDRMVRVFGYPTAGTVTDLYYIREKMYTSIDRELTIRFQ